MGKLDLIDMTEKQTPVSRALIAASKMSVPQARRVLMLVCESGMTLNVPQPTPGEIHYSKREKFIKRMKSSCDRVLDYSRHETLRNIEKHFRETSAIKSAEGGGAPTELRASLAARLTFDRSTFGAELLAALREDQEAALGTAGQQLFDEIGKDAVRRLPSEDALQFIEDRANLLANVPDEVHTEIMQSIEQGLQHGETRKELMARISTAFDEIGRSRAETIANTETAAAFNYARDKAMREAGVTHKRWLHSMSPLIKEPRPTHLEADGQTVPIDEPFDVGGVQFMRPADDSLGAGPEDIINCLPSFADVSASGVKKSFKRWFEGWLITITLRSGRRITATPNHPALEVHGWIPYCELKRSDYLIGAPFRNDFSGFQPEITNIPTTFDQIHGALKQSRSSGILGASRDFHGDGFNSNVDIVFTDSALMHGKCAALLEHLNQNSFELADAIEEFLPSLRMVQEFTPSSLLTSASVVGERSKSLSLSCVGSRHSHELGFGPTPDFDTSFSQSGAQPCARHSESKGDGVFTLSELICLDEIIDINATRFTGFVHNLDTKRGYYLSNGIFHRNCHCVAIPTEAPKE